MDCPPIPQFCHNFLLRSETHLERVPHPAQALEIGNSRCLTRLRMCLHTLQAANYTAVQWFTLAQGA